MYEIKEIKIWPFARALGIISMAVALIAEFCFIAFVIIIGETDPEEIIEDFANEPEIALGFLAFILGTSIALSIGGALGALIYNAVSQRLGGIKINIVYLGNDGPAASQNDTRAANNSPQS